MSAGNLISSDGILRVSDFNDRSMTITANLESVTLDLMDVFRGAYSVQSQGLALDVSD